MNRIEHERDVRYVEIRNKLRASAWLFAATSGFVLSDLDDLTQNAMEKVCAFIDEQAEKTGDTVFFTEELIRRATGFGAECVRNAVIDEVRRERLRQLPRDHLAADGDEDPPDQPGFGATPEENARATSLIRAMKCLTSKHRDIFIRALQALHDAGPARRCTRADLATITGLKHTQLSRIADEIVRRGIDDGTDLRTTR